MSGFLKENKKTSVVRSSGQEQVGQGFVDRSFEVRALDSSLREMGCLWGLSSRSDNLTSVKRVNQVAMLNIDSRVGS